MQILTKVKSAFVHSCFYCYCRCNFALTRMKPQIEYLTFKRMTNYDFPKEIPGDRLFPGACLHGYCSCRSGVGHASKNGRLAKTDAGIASADGHHGEKARASGPCSGHQHETRQ